MTTRKRYQEKRRWAIRYLGGACVQCGNTNYEDLQFDHKVAGTRFGNGVSMVLTWRKEVLIQELEKCQLLCVACYLEKTKQERKAKRCGLMP